MTGIVELLDVVDHGDGRYLGRPDSSAGERRVVEGSQILGQSVVAAMRRSPGRRPVSAWMAFVRTADPTDPLDFAIEPVTEGRTFTAIRAMVRQADRVCATGNLLLDVTAPDVIRHAVTASDVLGPDASRPSAFASDERDVRIVGDIDVGDPDAPTGPPELDAWVRFADVPADPALHTGLLAHFTGQLSIAAALRPHAGIGQDDAHRALSTAVNTISLSVHAPVRADRWMLYRHRSTFAGDGMTHSECRVHDEAGALLASFTNDCMVRSAVVATADATRGL
ncbi:MAG: thioesterase family protein [Microthrixaceae bacterium]|nr:thioesterase family protein [Microthrixaceae bacterium]